ncbi:MAG TPA: hypothetical protein VHF67_13405 [Gaiellaceae bacterium]|nr:hypothetical protein [Gaiellaceae bacterium]
MQAGSVEAIEADVDRLAEQINGRHMRDERDPADRACYPSCMDAAERTAVVVRPGGGHRVGNVEFLALSGHTPHFNLAVIEVRPHREGPDVDVHDHEDDSFYVSTAS